MILCSIFKIFETFICGFRCVCVFVIVRVFACVCTILCMCVCVMFVCVYLCAWQKHDMIRVALETSRLKRDLVPYMYGVSYSIT